VTRKKTPPSPFIGKALTSFHPGAVLCPALAGSGPRSLLTPPQPYAVLWTHRRSMWGLLAGGRGPVPKAAPLVGRHPYFGVLSGAVSLLVRLGWPVGLWGAGFFPSFPPFSPQSGGCALRTCSFVREILLPPIPETLLSTCRSTLRNNTLTLPKTRNFLGSPLCEQSPPAKILSNDDGCPPLSPGSLSLPQTSRSFFLVKRAPRP